MTTQDGLLLDDSGYRAVVGDQAWDWDRATEQWTRVTGDIVVSMLQRETAQRLRTLAKLPLERLAACGCRECMEAMLMQIQSQTTTTALRVKEGG